MYFINGVDVEFLPRFVASKAGKQHEISYDYYNDGSTDGGRFSRNRYNRSRIYKTVKKVRNLYHGSRNNKWLAKAANPQGAISLIEMVLYVD